jgi:hypothetical protein
VEFANNGEKPEIDILHAEQGPWSVDSLSSKHITKMHAFRRLSIARCKHPEEA